MGQQLPWDQKPLTEFFLSFGGGEVAQLCPTLCDPVGCNLLGFSVHGILQARILDPSPGDLPDPGIEPGSPALQADVLTSEPPGKQVHLPYIALGLKDNSIHDTNF